MIKSFEIFLTTESDTERLASARTEPHKHEFEELIVVTKGTLEHFIDFKSTVLNAPFLSFISKGKIHKVSTDLSKDGFKIWVLRFNSEFIPETTFQLYCYYHDHANIEMQKDNCFSRITTLCELMAAEMEQPNPDLSVVKQLLSTLFIVIGLERKKIEKEGSQLAGKNTTFKNFLKILEENYHRPEGVEFYADKLFMSSRNLNLICQKILQQSVSEIIETRKLIEAKNLLLNSDKTISEIGFELGYKEKSYFTNVFKKKSGQTPTEFRNEMAKITS